MAFPILAALPVIGKIVAPLLGKVFGVVDQLVEDKDLAAKIKAEVQMQAMAMDHKEAMTEIQAQADIVKAEIQGHSWIQRSWRPILMLVIVTIVANNYLFYPYLSMFTDKALILELPDHLWNLMSIGVGGYVVGRSGEQIVKRWKSKE
jgi:hypothetical protein